MTLIIVTAVLIASLYFGEIIIAHLDSIAMIRSGYHREQDTPFNEIRWKARKYGVASMYIIAIIAVAIIGQWWEGDIALLWFGGCVLNVLRY